MSTTTAGRNPSQGRRLRALIVGAGFGGIAAAIELRRHGITDVRILEKGPGLGGTWLYNSYPGAACDVPSHLYSYSFDKRLYWSRLCSTQPEILAYLQEVAREHGIDALITANTTVTSCAWDETSCRWTVHTDGGDEPRGRHPDHRHRPARPACVALARGRRQLRRAQLPLRRMGPLTTSSRARRVAVVGTGASAVQFIPEIARDVERLTVFQRTGNWFLPRKNRPYPAPLSSAIARLPWLQEMRRRFVFQYTESLTLTIRNPRTLGRVMAARSAAFMRSQLKDPDVRSRVWPDYQFGCKRIIFSSSFLPALQRRTSSSSPTRSRASRRRGR